MEDVMTALELPGFRFHPTEEELLDFYLKNTVYGKGMHLDIIGLLNIYLHDPWDLPGLAKVGEREWYFLVPRERKHGNGGRPNRTTDRGFWKATGSDKKITKLSDYKHIIGLRKTLVFYQGRAPGGRRTDWVMNEYRLLDSTRLPKDMVLCKIYRKATSLKVMEERAESVKALSTSPPSSFSPRDAVSSTGHFHEESFSSSYPQGMPSMKFEEEMKLVDQIEEEFNHIFKGTSTSALTYHSGKEDFGEARMSSFDLDWAQDNFWTQLMTPNMLDFNHGSDHKTT